MIARSIILAAGQLTDPGFRRVLAKGLALTVAGLIMLQVAVFALLGRLLPDSVTLPWIGEVGWLDEIASGAGVVALLVASIFLMIPVASAVISLFLDEVAGAVEARHYPTLPPARHVPLAESMADGARAFALVIAVNAFALIVYLILPPFAPLVFVAVNGFLLGREFFQLVAMRRMDRAAARALRRRNLPVIWAAGAVMAVPLVVPALNLVVPILGAAAFTHLFHSIAASGGRGGPDRRS